MVWEWGVGQSCGCSVSLASLLPGVDLITACDILDTVPGILLPSEGEPFSQASAPWVLLRYVRNEWQSRVRAGTEQAKGVGYF